MSDYDLLRQLIRVLDQAGDKPYIKDVAARMQLSHQEYQFGISMPTVESIAAYLYCLSKVDPATALEASRFILEAGGQWWSVQLALHILKQAQTEPA